MWIGKLLIVILFLFCTGCSVSNHPMAKQTRMLEKGELKDDTSYVYQLPYEPGNSHLIVQGYFGPFSHQNRAALDFKMKKGTKILAAREGVVRSLKEDSDKGGWSRKNREFGNYIIITHPDGSRAGYWHLQQNGALVNVGDTVQKGQVIALSGKTGYAAMPHLHFLVWGHDNTRQWSPLPTRFQTSNGIKYLRPMRKYRSVNGL